MKLQLSLKLHIPSILASFFLLVFLFAKTIAMPALISNGLIAGAGLLNLGYCMVKRRFPAKYLLTGFLFTISMVLSILYNGNASWMELLWVWAFLGAALVLTQWEISSKTIEKVFIVVLAVFAFKIATGVAPQAALPGISGNNISVVVLFYVILVYLKRFEENKKIIYWPCAAAILLSIWGNGRAGLLASCLLAALIFLYDYIFVQKLRISTLLKIGVLVLAALLLIDRYLGNYLDSFTDKVDHYGYTSSRTDIWAEYLRSAATSLPDFLFGVLADADTPLWISYGRNTHNAFLMLHAEYGVLCSVFVLFVFIKTFFTYIQRKKTICVIVMIVWCFRSIFDWTGFPGIFDVLFFYFWIRSTMVQR